MKKLTLALCLSVSALASASQWSELDNLVTSSATIKNKFIAGSSAVYGMEDHAVWNGFGNGNPSIPTQDALEQFKLLNPEVSDYNNAVSAFKQARMQSALNNFLETETWDAAMDMHRAVDSFVEASVAVAEVVRVADVAAEVQTLETTDESAALELGGQLQEYVQTNDVSLTETEVSEYNSSLDMVETAVSTFAAFTVVNNSPELKAALQDRMDTAQAYADASSVVSFDYTASGAEVTFQFASMQNTVAETFTVDVTDYLSTLQNQEFFDAGPSSSDYAMVVAIDCASNLSAPIGSCLPRNRFGPPPNVLLYDTQDGGNTFFVFAYTDADGNIIEFVDGDVVVDPQTGQQIGTYTGTGLVCDAGYEGYCNG